MKPKEKPLICQRCELEIYGPELRHVVRLSAGVMHGTCHKEQVKEVTATIDAALANGTHSVRDQSHPTVAEIRQRIEREQFERMERRRNQTHQPTGATP